MAVNRGTAVSQTLLLEGFEELARDLRSAGKDASKEFRDSLKPIGQLVARRAADVAQSKGLYSTGQLVGKLRQAGAVSVTNKGVTVTAKAKRGGYPYPTIYEYGGRANQISKSGKVSAVRKRSKAGAFLARSAGIQGALGEFGELGPRAFLTPALMQTQGEVMQMTEDWINTFLSKHNL